MAIVTLPTLADLGITDETPATFDAWAEALAKYGDRGCVAYFNVTWGTWHRTGVQSHPFEAVVSFAGDYDDIECETVGATAFEALRSAVTHGLAVIAEVGRHRG